VGYGEPPLRRSPSERDAAVPRNPEAVVVTVANAEVTPRIRTQIVPKVLQNSPNRTE